MSEPEVPLDEALRADFGEAIESSRVSGGILTVRARRDAIAGICAALKERHGFTFLVDLCAVDFPGRERRFEVVYHLGAPAMGLRVRLKATVGEGTPLPSVTGVWRAARAPEREAWDLFGISFEGHPDLSRLLLPDGFEGHPLRRDFPLEGLPDEEGTGD